MPKATWKDLQNPPPGEIEWWVCRGEIHLGSVVAHTWSVARELAKAKFGENCEVACL